MVTDAQARAAILRELAVTNNLGSLRRHIYLATNYGNSGPVGHGVYRFIHYGEPARLDDELKQQLLQALRRIDYAKAHELAAILEAGEAPAG